MAVADTELYRLLSELEYIPAEDLKKAKKSAVAEGRPLYKWLLDHDMLTSENLGQLLAGEYSLPYMHIGQQNVDPEVLRILPQEIAKKHQTVTVGLEDGELSIATSRPDSTDLFGMLVRKARATKYRLYYTTESDLEEALTFYREDLETVFDNLGLGEGKGSPTASVADILSAIIESAFSNKASDVHIEPTRESSLLRFRIDGMLHDITKIPKSMHDQLVSRIKVLSKLKTDEHLSAQDGRMRIRSENDHDIDIRVSIVPITAGEKTVLRILSSHNRQFGLGDLGMSEADLAKVKSGFMRPYGMVLSTGPTGSGKTTSMYSILKILNSREKNIATIEDPVEYEIDGINQIQVNTKTNLTFANGLRSILRQDPDIIYVGEIRDTETADIAVNSAMTGHLVLSTLHTNDAATALPRLIDMEIEPFLVASTVNVIVAQRLVRKTCNLCKVSIELKKESEEWQGDNRLAGQLAMIPERYIRQYFDKDNREVRLYIGKGCNACHHSGYNGRIGVFEVMEVSSAIHSLIVQKASADAIARQAIEEGMTTMMEDGLSKVQRGITTLDEILRATHE